MNKFRKYTTLVIFSVLAIILASCSQTAENEHLPEYCRTYSGFMATASGDMYELLEGVDRFNYLSVISEIELEFEMDDPNREIDLDGIQCFQNLTSLTLIGRSFKDISEISALKNIQKIALIDTHVVSINSFKNLSKVNELTISNTKTLQSVDGVEEMTKLTHLDLSDNGIVNIDGLNNLINLKTLVLRNNEITYFPSINQLDDLEELDVSNNNIIQLGEDLSGLSNLRIFNASENNICDLSTLDDLASLESLDLSFNNLGCGGLGVSPDFSSLENAPNLTEILLNDNNLSSIEGLRDKDIPLVSLHIENNLLTDITPISDYTGLRELVLFNNKIVTINNLSGMTGITEIDLSQNEIEDFTDLISIPDLEFIDLSENNITFIPDISAAWPSLRILDLEYNDITDTSGVEGHPNLRTLILNDNGMTALQGISNLPQLTDLILYRDDSVEPDPDVILPADNPNLISTLDNSYNSLPRLDIIDGTGELDLGYEFGPSVEIYGSFSDIENLTKVDFTELDVDVIDEFSFVLDDLVSIIVPDNNLTDISFILGNPELLQLDISGNPITNLTIISGASIDDLDNLEQILARNIPTGNDLSEAFVGLPDLSLVDLTGTSIVSITDSFNDLDQLTTLRIDGDTLVSIDNSFNNMFASHSSENVIDFSEGALGSITDSFNGGHYERIVMLDNNTSLLTTTINGSFNDLIVENLNGIVISGNLFETVTSSFNNVTCDNLFLLNNAIVTIDTSFDTTDIAFELNLQNNELANLDLSTITSVTDLDLSNNALTTVAFLDAIPGLETLDISGQLSTDGLSLTLTEIDGINNMISLVEVAYDDLGLTSIDGFKNIGITEFSLDFTANNDIFITSITALSFSSSLITDLDLGGHQFTDMDFLSNFSALTDLDISFNMIDISGLDAIVFEATLESLTLESVQNVPDFAIFADYDNLTFFAFDSDLTTTVNNFDGLDSVTNINFMSEEEILVFNNSFNNFASYSVGGGYLANYSSLTDINTSFDIFGTGGTNGSILIDGSINIVDSFNTAFDVTITNDVEIAPLFDAASFDVIEVITLTNPQYASFALFSNYTTLETLNIDALEVNITDLVNDSITSLDITSVDAAVTALTLDIAALADISLDRDDLSTFTITSDSQSFDFNTSTSDLVMNIDNTILNISGNTNDLTLNGATITDVNFISYNGSDLVFNTDSLDTTTSNALSGLDADNLEINSLVTSLSIDVRSSNINLYDNNTTTYIIDSPVAVAELFNTSPNLIIDFNGIDLTASYNTLETVNISGSFTDLTLNSTLLDTVTLNTSTITNVNLTSSEAIMAITGSNLTTVLLDNDSINDITLTIPGADASLTSTNNQSMNLDIDADVFNINMASLPDITVTDTSNLKTLELSSANSITQLILGSSTISDAVIRPNGASITVSATGGTELDILGNSLNTADLNVPTSDVTFETQQVSLVMDVIAGDLNIDSSLNLTSITLNALSSLANLDVTLSTSLDTMILNNSTIANVTASSNSGTFTISGTNVSNTTITDNSIISLDASLATNNITLNSVNTSALSADLTANTANLNIKANVLSLDNASVVDTIELSSSNLTSVVMGTSDIETLNIDDSSATLDITSTQLLALSVDSNTTSFNANLPLLATLDYVTGTAGTATIDTTTSDISVTAINDIIVNSSTLITSTLSIGSNDATMNVDKVSLDFTLSGRAGVVEFDQVNLDTLTIGAGAVIDDLQLLNTNITSLDLSPGTVEVLAIDSDISSLTITGNDLVTTTLTTNNLNTLVVNNTLGSASLVLNSQQASVSVSGNIFDLSIYDNSLTSANLTGLTNARLLVSSTSLASLDTLNTATSDLVLSVPTNNFDLTTDSPDVTVTSGSANTLDLTSSAASLVLDTDVDQVSLSGASTDFSITGSNLSGVDGTADILTVNDQIDTLVFTFDVDANTVIFDSDAISILQFTGARTINALDITSSTVNTFLTNSVAINTVDYDSTGVNTAVDSRALAINHTSGALNSATFEVRVNTQTITSSAGIVTLNSSNSSLTDFVYSGTSALDLSVSGLFSTVVTINTASTASIDATMQTLDITGNSLTNLTLDGAMTSITVTGSNTSALDITYDDASALNLAVSNYNALLVDASIASIMNLTASITDLSITGSSLSNLTIDGATTNTTISGTVIDTLDITALTVSNKYTMTDSLFTTLGFISPSLLASVTEIEINTLIVDIPAILTAVGGSGITLTSPLTAQNMFDHYYTPEFDSLTAQEIIDSVRYDSYKDPLVTAALVEMNANEYFDYLDDPTLTGHIDTQSYLTMQAYFDLYAAGEGFTEQEMIDSEDYDVPAIKAAIQATLDSATLVIDEVTINANVDSDIEAAATLHANTEAGNIGFIIG